MLIIANLQHGQKLGELDFNSKTVTKLIIKFANKKEFSLNCE